METPTNNPRGIGPREQRRRDFNRGVRLRGYSMTAVSGLLMGFGLLVGNSFFIFSSLIWGGMSIMTWRQLEE